MINEKEREIRNEIEELELNLEIEESRSEEVTKILSDKRHELDIKAANLYEERDAISKAIDLEYKLCDKITDNIHKLNSKLHQMAIANPSDEIINAKKLLESYNFTIFLK